MNTKRDSHDMIALALQTALKQGLSISYEYIRHIVYVDLGMEKKF